MFDSPVVSVHIPPALRGFSGGNEAITASGDTVGEVLEAVVHECPAMRCHLLSPDGQLPAGIAIFLGPRSIRDLQGLQTPIELEEVLTIVPTGQL